MHVTNATLALAANVKHGKSIVTLSNGKELHKFSVANLVPDKVESVALNLSLNIKQDIVLTLVGKNEVHLSGYFEPNQAMTTSG